MSTPAQMGKSEWRNAMRRAREANDELRGVLRRLTREGGPLVQALVNQAVLSVMDNESALNRLEEIGRNTKADR